MKKNTYILGGIIVLAGVVYYSTRKKLSFLGFGGKAKPNILFIGDSITADPKWSYPALLKKMRPDVNIDVLAKAGQKTSWMLSNLKARLDTKQYNKVFVYGGVNDALDYQTKTNTAQYNVQKMIDLARANGAEVYVILGYEPNKFMDVKKMPITRYIKRKEDYIPFIQRYKEIQSLYSKNLRNAKIISKINLGTFTSDGIHPNGSGQQKIADTINWYI